MIHTQKRGYAKNDTSKNNGYDLAGHAVQHSDLVDAPRGREVPHDQLVARDAIGATIVPDHVAWPLSHSSMTLLAPWTRTCLLAMLIYCLLSMLTCCLLPMLTCCLLSMLTCCMLSMLTRIGMKLASGRTFLHNGQHRLPWPMKAIAKDQIS